VSLYEVKADSMRDGSDVEAYDSMRWAWQMGSERSVGKREVSDDHAERVEERVPSLAWAQRRRRKEVVLGAVELIMAGLMRFSRLGDESDTTSSWFPRKALNNVDDVDGVDDVDDDGKLRPGSSFLDSTTCLRKLDQDCDMASYT
jgi:hypothetical protein